MERIRKIAVTGINATENPGPGIAVARSLKQHNPKLEIIGLSYDINDPGHYMDFCIDKSYLLTSPTYGWAGIYEKLKKIKEDVGLDLIIPCLDAELPLFILHQKELEEIGILCFLPSAEQFQLRDKKELTTFSQNLDSIYPKTFSVHSHDEISKTMEKEKMSFPLMIKGKYYQAYKVHNLEQCFHRFTEIANDWGLPVLIQEIVSGEEINLIGLGDGKGSHTGLMAIKKLSTTTLGKIWTGVTIQNSELIKKAESFLKKTNWKGPFELEYIIDENQFYLIEINPRFPAWAYFSTGCGLNLPAHIISILEGENFNTAFETPTGKLFVRYSYELITDIGQMAQIG